MNKRVIRIVSIFAVICFCLLALASCGGNSGYVTDYLEAKSKEPTEKEIEGGAKKTFDEAVDWAELQIFDAILDTLAEQEVTIPENLDEKLKAYVLDGDKEENAYEESIKALNDLVKPEHHSLIKEKIKTVMEEYCNLDQVKETWKQDLIKADLTRFTRMLENADDFTALSTDTNKEARKDLVEALKEKSSGCTSFFQASTNVKAEENFEYYKENEDKNVYKIFASYMVSVNVRQTEQEPISFQLRTNEGFGVFISDFFGNFFDNFLVFPVGIILWFTSSITGGWYIIGLFVTTLLIRTAGWPIYAKTNDMSLKMQVIQPEMQKLEEKYANRQDPDSQRMKQAELAQIYKKNKIGLGGCFLPFLQFPIFMAVYGAVRRFPYTVVTPDSQLFNTGWMDWANTTLFGGKMHSNLFFLPFDLFKDSSQGGWQLAGIIVLVILVCGTQFLSQFLSERRQKTNFNRQQEDIPEYRRKAYRQQKNQNQNMMKYVMYMMIFMMGSFVFTSKAGLGIYWLIGNLYSMLQMFINNELGQRKLKKMKAASENNYYTVIPNKDEKKKNKKNK